MMKSKDILATIRQYWHTAPVDVFAILRELDLGPAESPMPENISGKIERRDDGGFLVVLNSRQSMTRRRFTAAHELFHYIYQRDLLGRGVADTLAYRSTGTELPNEHITVADERQANTFAANLLMPTHLVDRLRAEGVTSPERLAARLGVSEAVMRIRLGLPAQPELAL